MSYMRIRFQKLGGHIHCRVFTATRADGTYANCGTLVFDEHEWPKVEQMFRNAEYINDERPETALRASDITEEQIENFLRNTGAH